MQSSEDAQRVCVLLPHRWGSFCRQEAPQRRLKHITGTPQPLSLGASSSAALYHLPGFGGKPSLRPHLQDGPIQPQQHLPGLLANAGQVVRQRAAEEQVAEAPAAEHTAVSASRGFPAPARPSRPARRKG